MSIFSRSPAPAPERREQIIEATLRLLARTPIEALTTRKLAAELGVSQPALFRHFTSREALLLAVVDHARAELEGVAVGIVGGGGPALGQVRALGQALLEHVERAPGLPRLLFAAAEPEDGPRLDGAASGPVPRTSARPLVEALRHLVAMQASLAAELVRQAQREGDLSTTIDAGEVATLFIGMIQGTVLRWEIAGRGEPLAARFPVLFDLWLHGAAPRAEQARAERPPARASERPAGAPVHDGGSPGKLGSAPKPPVASLDVRPMIARGVDPLGAILDAIEGLPRAGVLLIEAPFRPAPLLALLAQRGHAPSAEELGASRWLVEIVIGGSPRVEDLRDLEPPEPLERVLAASAKLEPGQVYLARLPRFPRMLVPHLRERGVAFEVLERPDGAALIRLEKKA